MGAAMAQRLPMARQSLTMVRVVNVFPQPGPPVSTITGATLACATAVRWPSLSRTPAAPHSAVACHHHICANFHGIAAGSHNAVASDTRRVSSIHAPWELVMCYS